MINFNYSKLESERFNKIIFRGKMDFFDIKLLEAFYAQNSPDILIFRIPVAEQPKLHDLNNLDKEIIFADTLVYYDVQLTENTLLPLKNKDISIRNVTTFQKDTLQALITEIFKNYHNHYYSNPLLNKDKIREGYSEWAVNTIGGQNNLNLMAYVAEVPIGFITCNNNSEEAEILLNGVLPEYESKGIYTDLLRFVKNFYHKINIPLLKISTQIQNLRVQKVWNREGFVLSSAFVTIHLNKKY